MSTATIAVLHLHDGLTFEEVAEVVGLSVSGVRKRLRKLKATLADLEGRATSEEAA
ncbi:MAG: winged helix-turn-helix transcriptional regulator [Nannocystaceae bacterium]